MKQLISCALAVLVFVASGLPARADDPTSRYVSLSPLPSSLTAGTTGNAVQLEIWDQPSGGNQISTEAHNVDVDGASRITNDTGSPDLLLGRPGGLNPANYPAGLSRYLDVTQSGASVLSGRVPLYASPFTVSPGPAGPPGPQGPPGATGPPGPVASVTAADSSIAVAGTASNPTVAVAPNGVTSAHVADGALSPSKIAGTAATLGSNSFNGNQNVTGNLVATANAVAGAAVNAINNAATGFSVGLQGTTNSSGGAGVNGFNNATTGFAVGVQGGTNSSTGAGVSGFNAATTGFAVGVQGGTNSSNGAGVNGTANGTNASGVNGFNSATSGFAVGVNGGTNSPNGAGVSGFNNATSGFAAGVVGGTNSPAGAGVSGNNSSTAGFALGVQGTTSSPGGVGVNGFNNATTGFAVGVQGGTNSPNGAGVNGTANGANASGVNGFNSATSGFAVGVNGTTNSPNGVGVNGFNSATSGYAVGVQGATASTSGAGVSGNSNLAGVFGVVGFNNANSGNAIGTEGASSSPNGVGLWGVSMTCTPGACNLVRGTAGQFQAATNGLLLQGLSGAEGADIGTSMQVFAVDGQGNGSFSGNVNIQGTLTAAVKNFKIEDPLDPRKYLYHASIESSEMTNIYSGNVVLDRKGAATVRLPEWFEALNGDFRYQLTPIGRAAPVYISQEIRDHEFKIAGGRPGMKVSWQVTGVRHDAWAQSHPLAVEADK